MICFIEAYRGVFGVEPICRVLPTAPSGYHAHAAITRASELASNQARQAENDLKEVKRIHDKSKGRYETRKV